LQVLAIEPLPKCITLALAHSNPLVLTAMAEIFDRDLRFSLVTTSANAEGFLSAVMRVKVAVGVIDWALPILGGQKLIEILRDRPGSPRLVVYGDESTGELARLSISAGAAAFVGQSAPVEKLLEACLAVAAGQMVFPFLDIRELQHDPMLQLTKRERALLEALAKGLTNRELAKEFSISDNTVKFHLSNLFEKLGVSNRTKAIAFYYAARAAGAAA
jgi:two-component system, NarL family, nitrate/nitrite response regulator NarP